MSCVVCRRGFSASSLCKRCRAVFDLLGLQNRLREWAEGISDRGMVVADLAAWPDGGAKGMMVERVWKSDWAHPHETMLRTEPEQVQCFSVHCLRFEMVRLLGEGKKFVLEKFKRYALPRMVRWRFQMEGFYGPSFMLEWKPIREELEARAMEMPAEVLRDAESLSEVYPRLLMRSLLEDVVRMDLQGKTSVVLEKSNGRVQGHKTSFGERDRASHYQYFREMAVPRSVVEQCQSEINEFTGRRGKVAKKHRSYSDRCVVTDVLPPALPEELDQEGSDGLGELAADAVSEALIAWLKGTAVEDLSIWRKALRE